MSHMFCTRVSQEKYIHFNYLPLFRVKIAKDQNLHIVVVYKLVQNEIKVKVYFATEIFKTSIHLMNLQNI